MFKRSLFKWCDGIKFTGICTCIWYIVVTEIFHFNILFFLNEFAIWIKNKTFLFKIPCSCPIINNKYIVKKAISMVAVRVNRHPLTEWKQLNFVSVFVYKDLVGLGLVHVWWLRWSEVKISVKHTICTRNKRTLPQQNLRSILWCMYNMNIYICLNKSQSTGKWWRKHKVTHDWKRLICVWPKN